MMRSMIQVAFLAAGVVLTAHGVSDPNGWLIAAGGTLLGVFSQMVSR